MKPTKVLLAAALLVLTGCSSAQHPLPDGPNSDIGTAGIVRVSAPQSAAAPADVQSVAGGSQALGLELLARLQKPGAHGNTAVSPASLEGALAMLLPGARGTTADEIRRLLGTGLDPAHYAAALGALRRAELGRAGSDKNTLGYADDVWIQQGFGVQPGYLRTLAGAFDTGVRTVDFGHDASGATGAINAQVSKETHGMIPQLFAPGSLDSSTVVALTDALYLHADWAMPFDHNRTAPAPFTLPGGRQVEVPTMQSTLAVGTGAADGWQIAELPYQGQHLAMDLLLPGDPAATLPSPAQLTAVLAAAGSEHAVVTLPRFHFAYGGELKPALELLGLHQVFTPGSADLSGIPTDRTPLVVTTVQQRCRVDVDEQGTTAAAATGVGVEAMGAVMSSQPLHFDRPFVFVIRDTVTGEVLFLGRITDPR